MYIIIYTKEINYYFLFYIYYIFYCFIYYSKIKNNDSIYFKILLQQKFDNVYIMPKKYYCVLFLKYYIFKKISL